MVLGLIFAGLHIREWFGCFDAGIKLSSGLFGQTFFSITGLHLLHVVPAWWRWRWWRASIPAGA